MKTDKIILSLFDYSGNWPKPYRDFGYKVIQVDKKLGIDIYQFDEFAISGTVHGVLAAPPCTDFTVSGAQYWPKKDADGTTEKSLNLVRRCLEIIENVKPNFWVLENPVGRLPKLLPTLGKPWYFQPCEFGDPWTKKTGLWGDFNRPDKTPVDPIVFSSQGSWTQLLGGKSERTKELRSMTPMGFAKAFFLANP